MKYEIIDDKDAGVRHVFVYPMFLSDLLEIAQTFFPGQPTNEITILGIPNPERFELAKIKLAGRLLTNIPR